MYQNPMVSAAAMDLGLRASLEKDQEDDAAKKKKQMQQQQNKAIMAPFSGAFMSLTGNQF